MIERFLSPLLCRVVSLSTSLTAAALAALVIAESAHGQTKPYAPRIEAASDEPAQFAKTIKVPDGFHVEVWAAEPRLAHPVCFWMTPTGDCYVAETFRHHAGVTDIREHMDWNDDDVAAKTVADRVAMYHKFLKDDFPSFETEHERVRLIRDTDGDGKSDTDSVFADGFHFAADGIGAGLLEHKGDVFFTCIPDVWKLRDTNSDGVADQRASLSTGWGVHVALLGHDMHGLQIGPDGKLYFSIGDRGFDVTTMEGVHLAHPHSGAVLRQNLDGSELEIFATGERNPQELAFDDYGDLFTGDNNSDGGDQARWVYVVEGSETGWRQAYQWLGEPDVRGPWNDERLWRPHFAGQAAYVLAPIANVAHGPSGLAYYPGTGLPKGYEGHFFLCDFEGATEWSGVVHFTNKRKGAGFEVTPEERFVWGPLATDCDFGYDGGLYVSDWVAGWNKTGKGRIWRAVDDRHTVVSDPTVLETRTLMRAGMGKDVRNEFELVKLLGHADRRVRQAAHLELGARGSPVRKLVADAAFDTRASLLARIHAIWALGIQLASEPKTSFPELEMLLADAEAEIRSQALRVCGNARYGRATDKYLQLLDDPSPRVQMFAALALARRHESKAIEPALRRLRDVKESDPWLRHALTYVLDSAAAPEALAALSKDPSVDARVAAVVALRRLKSPLVSRFLPDREPRVAAEAARAIYDVPIESELGALADQIKRPDLAALDVFVPIPKYKEVAGNGLVRRVLHANYRLGGEARARAIATFAAQPGPREHVRAEALRLLASWREPQGRDAFHGMWWPIGKREAPYLAALVESFVHAGVLPSPDPVLISWIQLAGQEKVASLSSQLTSLALDTKSDGAVRAAALLALGKIRPAGVRDTLGKTLFDPASAVRAAALDAFVTVAPEDVLPHLMSALDGARDERRVAYQGLARLKSDKADEALLAELGRLEIELVPGEVALDLVVAAEKRGTPVLKNSVAARAALRAHDPKLGRYLDALQGGDADKGREIFRGKSEVECLRCHRIADGDAGVVGPDLRAVGQRLTRLDVLTSIVDPNRRFSPGFQGSIVFVASGPPVEGLVLEDKPAGLKVQKADGNVVDIPRAEIEGIKPGLSAMPTNLNEHLSREEMRDLIEFLSTLR